MSKSCTNYVMVMRSVAALLLPQGYLTAAQPLLHCLKPTHTLSGISAGLSAMNKIFHEEPVGWDNFS